MISIESNRKLFKLICSLAVGPFVSQLLLLLASPLLTRLYTPTQFASVAVFLLAGTILASIICLKLDNAIIKTKSSREAARIAIVAIAISLAIVTLLSAIGVAALFWMGFKDEIRLCLLLIPYLVFGSFYDILNALALRRHLAEIVTRGRLVLAISSLLMQIVLGIDGGGAECFVFGIIVGYLCSAIFLALQLRINICQCNKVLKFNLSEILLKNRNDFIYGGSSALLLTIQNNLPAVLITYALGPVIGGYYTLIQRVVYNPIMVIVSIIAQSVLPWISREKVQDSVIFLIKKLIVAGLAIVGLVLAAYPGADQFFGVVFGNEWSEAGRLASYLLLLLPYRIVFDILSVILVFENRQGTVMATRGLTLAAFVICLLYVNKIETDDLFYWLSFVQGFGASVGIFMIGIVLQINLYQFAKLMIGFLFSYIFIFLEGWLGIFIASDVLQNLIVAIGLSIFSASVFTFRLHSKKDAV